VTDTLEFLREHGVTWRAVSRGGRPLVWAGPDGAGGTVEVPAVRVADTLGAGDFLHGALAHHLASRTHHRAARDSLTPEGFAEALRGATAVASRACASFGTRAWMREG
jgi:sugar/nucleoside kinase (ribokinase family)